MRAAPAGRLWAQHLQGKNHLMNPGHRWSKCAKGSLGRAARKVPFMASSNVGPVTSKLVVDSVSDINNKFGWPGDYVVNGISPYKGCVIKTNKHDGLYGYGRYLVQNKGLVLYAIDNPLPGTVEGGNETEKAIILAIAMQESDWMDTRDIGTPVKTGSAENKSCLNICVDMLDRTKTDWRNADNGVELHGVVGCLLLWLRGQVSDQQNRTEHLKDTLNFVRGGFSAFDNNGKISFSNKEKDTNDYLNAIASIYRELRWNATASEWNDNMNVPVGARNDIPNWDSSSLWANNSRIRIDIPGI